MHNSFADGAMWAILPAQFDALREQYQRLIEKPEFSKEAIASFDNTEKIKLNAVDGVAVVRISGAISNHDSFFSRYFGGASIPRIRRELQHAERDSGITSVVLDIDSPGGTVNGVDDLAAYIRGYSKPIVAFSGGMMMSAATWLGTAADSVIIGKTADAGSIGVLMVHVEFSEEDKRWGWKYTVMKAGKYKAIGNPYEPLSDEAKEIFQAELDYLYSIFVETVAKNRKVTVAKALPMADGQTFIGQQAVDIGLVDELGTLESAIEEARKMGTNRVSYFLKTGKVRRPKMTTNVGSIEEIKAAFPELAAKLIEEGANSVDVQGAVDLAKEELLSLAECFLGKEQYLTFKALVDSGITADHYKVVKDTIPAPEAPAPGTVNEQILKELQDGSPENPGGGAGGDEPDKPKDFMTAWQQIKADEKCSTRSAMSKAARLYPDLFEKHTSKK